MSGSRQEHLRKVGELCLQVLCALRWRGTPQHSFQGWLIQLHRAIGALVGLDGGFPEIQQCGDPARPHGGAEISLARLLYWCSFEVIGRVD